jgi:hypothetical protein
VKETGKALLAANRFLAIPALPKGIMSITHIVLFQFKSGIDAQVVKDVRLLSPLSHMGF